MANSLIARKRIRKNFGKIAEVAKMPNLIEVQKTSYDQFLQLGVPVSQRSNTGLQEVFTSVFPIRDFSERAELQFVRLLHGVGVNGHERVEQVESDRLWGSHEILSSILQAVPAGMEASYRFGNGKGKTRICRPVRWKGYLCASDVEDG